MSRVYFTDRDLGKYQTYAVERDCWPAQAGEQIKRKRADKGNGIPHLVPLAPRLTWPAGGRAAADRVARSAVLMRGEPVTWGRHLRQPS